MSSAIMPDPATLVTDPATRETMPPEAASPGRLPGHVTRHLVSGTSVLGMSVFVERGMGFLANLLAARLGGAATFGTYALAISTANNISTYAAGGIGATATRFSGKYPYASPAYPTLARALAIVSAVSALLAALGIWLGAGPLAHLLQKESLAGLLRWAAISAAGIILLECARGFFVGQRRLAALLLLSLLVGAGMVALIPLAAAHHSPTRMIVSQGLIAGGAVLVCLLMARPLGLLGTGLHAPGRLATGTVRAPRLLPMLKEVWSFGFMQLAGLIGANVAGWWLTTLVARSDTSLVQMGYFAIASQLRNLAGLAPGLLTEGSYAIMANPDGEAARTPHNVMAVCTYASTFVSLSLTAVGTIVMPWAITLAYGKAYAPAAVTASLGLAIAVAHMGNAPASARLSIVSIRDTALTNTGWAIFVALAATLFLFHPGTAAEAMAIYLVAHVLVAGVVLLVLHRKDYVPRGMTSIFVIGSLTSLLLPALAFFRERRPAASLPITAAMLLIVCIAFAALWQTGKRHHWLPAPAAIARLIAYAGTAWKQRGGRA